MSGLGGRYKERRREKKEGGGQMGASMGVGIDTARQRGWEGRAVTQPIIIVRACLLFIKLSPVIVSELLPHNVPKDPSLFIHSLVLCSTGLRLSYISPPSTIRWL